MNLIKNYIKDLVTLISVLSAAMTIALREIILNFFCGIYIQVKKPFKVEDRIDIMFSTDSEELKEIIDRSLTQTIGRSVFTTLTIQNKTDNMHTTADINNAIRDFFTVSPQNHPYYSI